MSVRNPDIPKHRFLGIRGHVYWWKVNWRLGIE